MTYYFLSIFTNANESSSSSFSTFSTSSLSSSIYAFKLFNSKSLSSSLNSSSSSSSGDNSCCLIKCFKVSISLSSSFNSLDRTSFNSIELSLVLAKEQTFFY